MPHITTFSGYSITCWVVFLAADVSHADEQPLAETRLVITDQAGHETSGQLQKLDFNVIRVVNSKVFERPVGQLQQIRFTNRRKQTVPATSLIFLDNGDELSAEFVEITEEFLLAYWNPPRTTKVSTGRQQLKIPLEAVRAILFSAAENSPKKLQNLQQRLLSTYNADHLLLKNGDYLAGELQKFNKGQFLFQVGNQERKIALSDVRGLAMNEELISFPKLPARRWVVSLIDGSVFTVTNCDWTNKQNLRVTGAWGSQFTLPVEAISSIVFLGGRVVYLSQLSPERYQCTTYFSSVSSWKLAVNRNLFGNRLKIRDRLYLFGLGMHSRSEATFSLNGKYEIFRSQIGIDDSAEGKGNVRFVIELDGKSVYTSQNITGRMKPLSIPALNVANADKMRIIVEYGDRGDIADHADWANAILVRKSR